MGTGLIRLFSATCGRNNATLLSLAAAGAGWGFALTDTLLACALWSSSAGSIYVVRISK